MSLRILLLVLCLLYPQIALGQIDAPTQRTTVWGPRPAEARDFYKYRDRVYAQLIALFQKTRIPKDVLISINIAHSGKITELHVITPGKEIVGKHAIDSMRSIISALSTAQLPPLPASFIAPEVVIAFDQARLTAAQKSAHDKPIADEDLMWPKAPRTEKDTSEPAK